MQAREDEALVGHVLGERYRVRSILGAGATGTVFAVDHLTLARPFVAKVLRARRSPMEFVTKVFEADTPPAFRVSHPSLCQVIDAGTSLDGAPYFVTELLEGETLAAVLERKPLSLDTAVDLMTQFLSVMGHVHEHGLLLRDPRPQNLFLVYRRRCRPLLKVLDFGLARLLPLDRAEASWKTPALISAAHYLSPERSRGDLGSEPSSDVFVASAILYEALSGTRPFTSTSFTGLLDEIAHGRHTPLHEVRRDIPLALSQFVSRGLAAHPGERFATPDVMYDELGEALDELPIFEADIDSANETVYTRESQTAIDVSELLMPVADQLDLPRFSMEEDEDNISTAGRRRAPLILAEDARPIRPRDRDVTRPDLRGREPTGEEETRKMERRARVAAMASPPAPARKE